MFDSSSSEKSSGLFSGVPTISSGNLFQVSSTRDNKPSDTGLFGMLTASTTESKTECGIPTFGFTSNQKSDENGVKSGNLFNPSPSNSNPIQGQHSTPLTVNINSSVGARRDLDSPEDFDNYAKCSDSNDIQSVDQTHWPAVKLSRLPIGNNTKAYLQNQFQRFGRIERIICQPSLDSAYVAFDSVSSASRAKRLGREPVSPDDGGLPSTVLLTMSRCRRFSNSGSRSSPKLGSTSSFSMISSNNKSHLSSARTSGLKRPILSRTHTKPIANKKQFSSVMDSSDDNQSPVTSSPEVVTKTLSSSLLPLPQPPVPASTSASLLPPLPSLSQTVYSTQSIISPISLPNTPIHNNNNNNLFPQKSVYAVTLEERLSLLQEYYKRDCELRSKSTDSINQYSVAYHNNNSSNTDEPIHHAPIKGTCEDMCPELERYLRAVHQRVSIFECLPSTLSSNSSSWEMDHTRAVKDYQRSSADQPVPLPRELRPTHVLQRTMAYLLATIADRPEIDTTRSLWKPWYEFMWTRTRAIRKDIRQQNLCCPIVISVIERIARFHIFCAARLVDQPVDSFDPRINSENLTQCLQTLKEMYSDLEMLNSSSASSAHIIIFVFIVF
ncbi:unnamed protein product [Trichobilharzia szidati]|nr:unnamed protein product [Trichobilharzia szidati]